MNNTDLKKRLDLQKQTTTLHTLMGRSVWSIQHLEDALSHSIAIKNPEAITKAVADKMLEANRKLTLGQSVKLAKKEKVYDGQLQDRLDTFLEDRNWLIHKSMRESVDESGLILDEVVLFKKIQDIGLSASSLVEAVTIDMLEFTSSKGRPDVREKLKQHFLEWIRVHG